MDLRLLNGRQANSIFDKFWAATSDYLESMARVDDRRHGESCIRGA